MSKTKFDLIFSKGWDRPLSYFKLEDITVDILPTDEIHFEVDHEGYYSENNSWDPHTSLRVLRERPMTDEELAKEKNKDEIEKSERLKSRRELYERLKKEFEPKP